MDPVLMVLLGVFVVLLLVWGARNLLARRKAGAAPLPAPATAPMRDAQRSSASKVARPPKKPAQDAGMETVGEDAGEVLSPEDAVAEDASVDQALGGDQEKTAVPGLEDSSLAALIVDYTAAPETRLAAVREAGMRKLNLAVPQLIESLYDPEASISAAAAESLGVIGDPRAIEPLLDISRALDLKLLEGAPPGIVKEEKPDATEGEADSEPVTGRDLVIANPFKYKELTTFRLDLLPKEYFQPDGSPIPRKDLVHRGLKDTDQQLRKMAAKAAIGLDDPDLVAPLSEVLNNPYEVESVRYLAAEALGGISDEKSLEALVGALADENIAVRYSAAAAIGQFESDSAVSALKKALADPNEFVRSSVAYALGQIHRPEALDALFGAINDKDEVVRFSVAKALGHIGGGEVVAGLEKRLKTPDRKMKLGLIEVLGHVKEDRAIQLLREALRDPDSEISFQASLALMSQESLDALDELIAATHRLDQELMDWVKPGRKPAPVAPSAPPEASEFPGFFQREETSGLENLPGSEDALDKLEEALHHESPNVRGCAANTLGDFSDPRALDLLIAALGDPHEYVRATAVSSLAKMQNPECLSVMLKLNQDSSEDVRYALAKGLAHFPKDSRVLFVLNQLAEKDTSKDVKRLARKELERSKIPVPPPSAPETSPQAESTPPAS